MSEKVPETLGFERMETQLVREAVRSAGELYIEEIARSALKNYPGDKTKQGEFVSNTWTFSTMFDLYHLMNEENLKSLWGTIRESTALSVTVLNTAVKLRGMYSDTDWALLMSQLSEGLDVMRAVEFSVMDDTATKPMESRVKTIERLSANLWVVPLLLMSYAPLLSLPAPLTTLLRAVESATPVRGNAS